MSVALSETVRKMVESEVRTIKAEYRGVVSEESIDSMADESLHRLAGSRVPQFVPLFVGRFTRERIKEMTGSSRLRAGGSLESKRTALAEAPPSGRRAD